MQRKILIAFSLLSVLVFLGCVQEAKNNLNETVMDNTNQQVAEVVKNIKEDVAKDVVDPEEAVLIGVGGYTGGALASRSYLDGEFNHTVLADIGAPAEGKFYEGWLVKSSPSLEFFSTGRMELADDMYYLEYTADEDKSDFNEVVITEETEADGLDGAPETHVLEGEF